jgi:hypothetical protein
MSTNRKATMAKRARELEQKDRAKERETRRAERKQRAEERTASGQVGPEIGQPVSYDDDGAIAAVVSTPTVSSDGPDLPAQSPLAERSRPS